MPRGSRRRDGPATRDQPGHADRRLRRAKARRIAKSTEGCLRDSVCRDPGGGDAPSGARGARGHDHPIASVPPVRLARQGDGPVDTAHPRAQAADGASGRRGKGRDRMARASRFRAHATSIGTSAMREGDDGMMRATMMAIGDDDGRMSFGGRGRETRTRDHRRRNAPSGEPDGAFRSSSIDHHHRSTIIIHRPGRCVTREDGRLRRGGCRAGGRRRRPALRRRRARCAARRERGATARASSPAPPP
jgi:hypothetical protein